MTTQVRRETTRARARTIRSAPPKAVQVRSPRLSNKVMLGLFILGVMLMVALFAPQIATHDTAGINAQERLLGPSTSHFFGTDSYGRDLFSRVVYGSRISLGVAVSAVFIGLLPGVFIGMLAGMYRGGLWESLITQTVDAWMALPGLLVALVMVATFGRSLNVLTWALGISMIPMFYRLSRGETMRVSMELYVEAATSLGASKRRILFTHILPNIASPIIVMVALACGRMLLATSALSFIGLGAPPPTPEWGSLIAEGRDYMHSAWWLIWFPGLTIAITTFGFHLLGNGLVSRRNRE